MTRELNVALLGYKFMGKAHSYALLATPFFFKTGIQPIRKVICGRHEGPLKQAAEDFGWAESSTDWRETVRRDDIDVVSIVTPPSTHAEMVRDARAPRTSPSSSSTLPTTRRTLPSTTGAGCPKARDATAAAV